MWQTGATERLQRDAGTFVSQQKQMIVRPDGAHASVGLALVSLIATLLIASVTDVSEAQARRASRCDQKATTVTANGYARVTKSRGIGGGSGYFLCRDNARTIWLGDYDSEAGGGVTSPRLAGRWLAWDAVLCSKEGPCSGGVRLLNVRTGRRRGLSGPVPFAPGDQISHVSALVVTARGSVAWTRRQRLPATGYDVTARPANAAAVLLEGADTVDPGSLAAAGGRVYWTSDQTPHSARLP